MFFCEFCKISKNTFFVEHVWWLLPQIYRRELISYFLSLRLEGEETLKYRCVCRPPPRTERFNIVSNDHGRTQKYPLWEFEVRKYFTDHHIPYTTHGFGDSVLVGKIHDCYCRIPKNLEQYIPSHSSEKRS